MARVQALSKHHTINNNYYYALISITLRPAIGIITVYVDHHTHKKKNLKKIQSLPHGGPSFAHNDQDFRVVKVIKLNKICI